MAGALDVMAGRDSVGVDKGGLRLNDKEVEIAVGIGLSAGMRTEQDDLRARGGRSQTARRVGNQGLVHCLQGQENRSWPCRSLSSKRAIPGNDRTENSC